jgi:1-acyl-sn-glycerol-3-phosphate acyltransferase
LAHREYFTGKNAIIFPFNYFAILYVRANGCIPVEKAGGDLAKALGEAVRVLNTGGENFWIYPEGVMSRDGDLHQGKRGVAYLHQQTNVPIVPVGIRGNFRAFKLKNLILRRSKITLVFGKPIYSLPSKTLEEGANFVMERIAELTGQTYDPNNK